MSAAPVREAAVLHGALLREAGRIVPPLPGLLAVRQQLEHAQLPLVLVHHLSQT